VLIADHVDAHEFLYRCFREDGHRVVALPAPAWQERSKLLNDTRYLECLIYGLPVSNRKLVLGSIDQWLTLLQAEDLLRLLAIPGISIGGVLHRGEILTDAAQSKLSQWCDAGLKLATLSHRLNQDLQLRGFASVVLPMPFTPEYLMLTRQLSTGDPRPLRCSRPQSPADGPVVSLVGTIFRSSGLGRWIDAISASGRREVRLALVGGVFPNAEKELHRAHRLGVHVDARRARPIGRDFRMLTEAELLQGVWAADCISLVREGNRRDAASAVLQVAVGSGAPVIALADSEAGEELHRRRIPGAVDPTELPDVVAALDVRATVSVPVSQWTDVSTIAQLTTAWVEWLMGG